MSNYVPPTAPMGQPPQHPGGPPGYYQGQPPQTPQPKSKAWIWVLGGCGTVILLGVIAAGILVFLAARKVQEVGSDFEKNPSLAVAKMVVAANPDIEMVSVDEEKGVIVIKEKDTGKQITVNFEDASNGKFVFQEDGKDAVTLEAKGESGAVELKSKEGSIKVGPGSDADIPGWLPAYPGTAPQGNFSMKAPDGETGSFHFTTNDSIEKVMAFYEAELKSAGFTVNTTYGRQSGAASGGIVNAEEKSNKRSVNVSLSSEKGATQVNVVFVIKS